MEFIGKDGNGIPRVWGAGPSPDIAETECRIKILEYVSERPDTGPVSSWTVEPKSRLTSQ